MINIISYISKDLVFGAIGGSILATIFTSIIDGKIIDKSNKELKLSNEQLKKAAENLEFYSNLIDEQTKIIEDQNKVQKEANNKIKELEEKLRQYIVKEVKEKEEQEEKEKVREAIKKKQWDDVYRWTEHWYNHTPCQMSRAEVFGNLKTEGYIIQEEQTEAYNYFGNLWFYVGD